MSRSSLSGLSDRELLSQISQLVRKERTTTLEVLSLLDEIDRRKLYLSLGYGSLFDYCTRHLKYSASSAVRRIQTARSIRRFPEIQGLLETGEVNLSTVSLVSDVLTEENKNDLLGRIRTKSQKDVEMIVAEYKAPVSLRDRVRPVRVAVPAPAVKDAAAGNPSGLGELPQNCCNPLILHNRCGGKTPTTEHGTPTSSHQKTEQKLLVQFLASEAFMKKFERARALLSSRLGETTFGRVFETLIDEFIDRHSPESRKGRREKRITKRERPRRSSRPNCPDANPRRIPASIRDAVFGRDNGRCTYVGATGERCNATHNLQIDHIEPYSRGGSNTPENLRLLCAKHNRLEGERLLGAGAMARRTPTRQHAAGDSP